MADLKLAMEMPYTYLISNVSGVYSVRDAYGRETNFGTDFSTVWNACVAALGSHGGTIKISEGDHTVTAALNGKGRVKMKGAGMYSTGLILGYTGNVIEWKPSSTEQFFAVEDLYINGNKASYSGKGIYLAGNTYDFQISHVWIYNCKLSGIHIVNTYWGMRAWALTIESGDSYGLYCQGGTEGTFIGCRFASNGSHGVYGYYYNITFIGCEMESNTGDGINLVSGTYGTRILGCMIGSNHAHGIQVANAEVVIHGCRILSNSTRGVTVASGAADVIITGNTFYANGGGTISDSGTRTKIKDNRGYVTENSGVSDGTGAQQTIAHGCNFTPTEANVILNNIDNGANPYLSATTDATNIYVTAVLNLTYRWEVRKT